MPWAAAMAEPPLFDVPPPERQVQLCDLCLKTAAANDDQLLYLGWLVYDGLSETGRLLHVRICPPCQARAARLMELSEKGTHPCTPTTLL